MTEYMLEENPDMIAFGETKLTEAKVDAFKKKLPEGYFKYFHCSTGKKGYSGVALLSKIEPVSVVYGFGNEAFDCEGRLITAEFDDFYLVCTYVPNAGVGLKRLDFRMEWDALFKAYLVGLNEKKSVVLCGDLNVSHKEIDLKNPKGNVCCFGLC